MIVKRRYFSYLLRLWQAGTGQGAAWRASLEEIPTGERRAFASLDDLFAYLREQTRASPPPEEGRAGEGSQPGPGDGADSPGREEG
jgi:hypothetical protein